MSRELRMAAHQAELDAIKALCHHDWFSKGCDACVFRQQAAVEHLQAVFAQAIVSLELGE